MNKHIMAAGLAALVAGGTPAFAGVTVSADGPGTYFSSVNGSVSTFDGANPFNGALVATQFGTTHIVAYPGNPGYAAEPYGDTTNFYAVQGASQAVATYAKPENYFGLYWGSIDSYNHISFYLNGNLVAAYNGSQIAAAVSLIPDGDQHNFDANRFVNFTFTGGSRFNQVVFGSDANAFESDNWTVSSGVPEPSIWMMMLIGFGVLGIRLRCRNAGELA